MRPECSTFSRSDESVQKLKTSLVFLPEFERRFIPDKLLTLFGLQKIIGIKVKTVNYIYFMLLNSNNNFLHSIIWRRDFDRSRFGLVRFGSEP